MINLSHLSSEDLCFAKALLRGLGSKEVEKLDCKNFLSVENFHGVKFQIPTNLLRANRCSIIVKPYKVQGETGYDLLFTSEYTEKLSGKNIVNVKAEYSDIIFKELKVHFFNFIK